MDNNEKCPACGTLNVPWHQEFELSGYPFNHYKCRSCSHKYGNDPATGAYGYEDVDKTTE